MVVINADSLCSVRWRNVNHFRARGNSSTRGASFVTVSHLSPAGWREIGREEVMQLRVRQREQSSQPSPTEDCVGRNGLETRVFEGISRVGHCDTLEDWCLMRSVDVWTIWDSNSILLLVYWWGRGPEFDSTHARRRLLLFLFLSAQKVDNMVRRVGIHTRKRVGTPQCAGLDGRIRTPFSHCR